MTRKVSSALGAVFLLAGLAEAQTAASRFRMTATTLQLVPGDPSGTVYVTVLARFQAADKRVKGPATLVDATPNATSVTITTSPVQASDALEQTWRFTVVVKGLPKNTTQARAFVIAYATFRDKLEYTLTNVNSTAFAWSVKAATEWNVDSQKAFEIPLRIGDVPATNTSLHQVALISEDKLKQTLGNEHFQLCESAGGNCSAPQPTLSPRTPYTLYLRPTGQLPPGIFKGTVSLAATEKTDPEVLTLTLYSPRPGGKRWGLAALTAGVLLSLLLQVAPNFVQRSRERAAVAQLRKRLDADKAEFAQLPPLIQTAAAEWLSRADHLAVDFGELDDGVRGPVPAPFAQEVSKLETFKDDLQRHGNTLLFLRMLLRDGLEVVAVIMIRFPAHDEAVAIAAEQIATVPAGDTAADEIKNALDTLRTAAKVPGPARLAAAHTKSAASTFDAMQLHIVAASLVVWVVWAMLSVLTGALLLVFQNPGFGTTSDYLYCFAWGAGISFAGQQATQMTTGGVATAIGVKLPGK